MPTWPFPQTPLIPTPVIPSGQSALVARTAADDAWEALRVAAVTQGANYEALNVQYLGAGRFVPVPIDAAFNPTIGTGLTLRVQNATYMVNGRIFVVSNVSPTYVVVSGVLPSHAGGIDV